MIYVFEGGSVVYDSSTISEEQKAKAVTVETLSIAQTPDGKLAILKADKQTETVYYEYVDKPQDPEIENIKKQLQLTQQAVDDLIFNGGAL